LVRALVAVLAGVAVLGACSSAADGGRTLPAPSGSTGNVVDGITIPPPYVAPPVRVVAAPRDCPTGALATMRRAANAPVTTRSERSEHLLTCTYQAGSVAPGRCSRAVVRVNTEPQAFAAFDRWNVETGQNSMWGNNPKLQPVPVRGIGILAEWAPALHELGTANNTTWVSVVVGCPDNSQSVPPLARTLAKAGLASSA
jgi:hypothetical protein